jgi:hypothetical protein
MHRKLLILAVAAVFLLGACGDDDDDGGTLGFPGQGGTTQPGQVPGANADPSGQAPGAGGDAGSGGYDEAMHGDFVNECSNFPGSSQPVCECAWGQITSSVPFEEYQAFATSFASGDTALPDWLTSAVSSCA